MGDLAMQISHIVYLLVNYVENGGQENEFSTLRR